MSKWSEAETKELVSSMSDGYTLDEMCRQYPSRSRDAIRVKMKRLAEPESYPEEQIKSFEISAAVSSQEKDEVETLWDYYTKKNYTAIEKATQGYKFKARFNQGPIALSFLSDQHIAGGNACDLGRMKSDAEYIRDTPNMYCCLVGDGIDNHIKHKSAVIDAKSTPDEQYQLYNYYLKILHEKVVVAISGNHDQWSGDVAGVDVVKRLADANKIHYSTNEAFIELTVGSVPYMVAFRHQYKMNSTFNQTHAVKQWLRLGNEEFDIGAVGHHHEAAIESFFYRGKETWVCRPGSYQITSYYASKYGFQIATPTCPTFILFPNRREIVGFSNLYHAGSFLQHLHS